MKRIFEMPEIEIVKFETEAVLSASFKTDEDDLGWEEI